MSKITHLLLYTILIAVCFTQSITAQFNIPEKPAFQTSIYDYISLLSNSEKKNLEDKLIRYSDTTSTQIVVIIIGSTNGENIGLLAPKWGQEWGIGQAKEDNGVVILLARDDRNIWISPGYGVEDRLTAGIVGELTRNVIIPEFKKGDYYQGLNRGVDAILEVLTGAYQGTRKSSNGKGSGIPIGIIIVFIIFIIIIAKNRRGGGGRHGGRQWCRPGLLEAIILSNMGRRSSSGGGFGGSSGGGFGGGFGGGGFSGGGAGGSW